MALTLHTDLLKTKTANYVATTSDDAILANGAITIFLYAVSNNAQRTLTIKNIGASNVTVSGNGTELIDSANTLTLSSLESVMLVSDGTQWWKKTSSSGVGGPTNITISLLDNLGTSFNGSQTVFTLTSSSVNVAPTTAQNLLISINGIIQQPGNAYTTSGNTITFTTAPDTNSAFFGMIYRQDSGTTAYGKAEAQLNVNSAVYVTESLLANTANNSTYAYGKTEGNLNVNSALTANNSTYAYGKTEGNLNVNSALTANNSTYAFGKSEGALNVNSALTANNSTNAFGKTEGNLNVNNATTAGTANNATNAYGKTEGNLNVNSAVNVTGSATLSAQPATIVNLLANTANLVSGNATALFFDNEFVDTGNQHSTTANTSKFFAASTGYYLCCATVQFFDSQNMTSTRRAWVRKDGTNGFGWQESNMNLNNTGTFIATTVVLSLTAGEYVEVMASVDAGNSCYIVGGTTVNTHFQFVKLF